MPQVKAKDGTTKFLLQLADNHVVETVGIPLDDADKQRLTVCVSSQVWLPAIVLSQFLLSALACCASHRMQTRSSSVVQWVCPAYSSLNSMDP